MTEQFGALLRHFRWQAGLTQEELATRAKIAVRTIRRFETEVRANPQLNTVRQLAGALDLSESDQARLLATVYRHGSQAIQPATVDSPGTEAPPEDVRPDPARYLTANERELLEAADELADVVRARWQHEEIRRRIHDPGPVPVHWRSVSAELADPDAPANLDGTLDEIVSRYRRVPSGRLVLLGKAGAGKSMLAVRLVLDLLEPAKVAGAVPVVIGIGSWHPARTSFHEWLATQLTQYYPGLAKPSRSGSTLAARLIESGRILPVLDGFDEIADGLHQPALDALNQITLPLVLTSRPDEYRDAVKATRILRGAAAVELTDLTVADLAGYLPDTARKAASHTVTSWDPVLRELERHPERPLAAVLTTPLMVSLARAIYSDPAAGNQAIPAAKGAEDTAARDPAELLNNERFPDAESISDHLLTSFVHTAYRRQPLDRAVGLDQRWSVDQATRWLRFIATHLTRRRTTDLAWWEFGTALRRAPRTLVLGLFAGITATVVDWLVEGAASAFGVEIGILPWFVSGPLIGVLGAVLMVISYGLVIGRAVPMPLYFKIGLRGGWRSNAEAKARLRNGVACGFLFGVSFGTAHKVLQVVTTRSTGALAVWIVDALMFGLVYALGVAFVFWILNMIETPVDLASAGEPADLINSNRALLLGPSFALVPLFAGYIVATANILDSLDAGRPFGLELDWAPSLVVVAGLVSALGGGAGYMFGMTPWGQWLVFGRIWLPLTGRLPWAVVAFLEDACQRGALRQSGPYYQFRHARLQAHLAASGETPSQRSDPPLGSQ